MFQLLNDCALQLMLFHVVSDHFSFLRNCCRLLVIHSSWMVFCRSEVLLAFRRCIWFLCFVFWVVSSGLKVFDVFCRFGLFQDCFVFHKFSLLFEI